MSIKSTNKYLPMPISAGCVGVYIHDTYRYGVLEKISDLSQALWVETILPKNANIICEVFYR